MENIDSNVNKSNVKVLSNTIAAKASSKYEIYVLLQIEAKIYLPKADTITIYFLKECKFVIIFINSRLVISGKKLHVK